VIDPRAGRRAALALCLVLVALLAAPAGPAGAATWSGRYSIWHARAFAPQYLDASCVGATIQIMLNLIDGGSDSGKRNQLRYLDYAQQQSLYPVEDGGADPDGWAKALVHLGAGDGYGWTTTRTMESALHTAAKQMRETGKPVGLLVHFGRHAWVMSGFEADADPAQTDDFNVTAAEVVGPLWPLGTLNGQRFDPGPGTWLDTRALTRKFDAYVEPGQPVWYGKYVTILPRADEAPVDEPDDPGSDRPDIKSALGWITIFNRLAQRFAVRDLLWLP
jgi:hypothetical protein